VSQSGNGKLVTVFGGSGFVGRHVVRALARDGWRIKVAVRRPDLATHLQPLGGVGQIQGVQANLRYPASVRAALEGSDAVVNLVGILFESGQQSFDAVHAYGAGAIAEAAREAGVGTMVHVSAIGADEASEAVYARTKAAGESFVTKEFKDAVILRPSVIFGPEDNFFNLFASLARISPVLPLIGGGETKFQPVFVGDVAEAVRAALSGKAKAGTVYELGGPEVASFREILEFIAATINRKRLLVPWPFWLAKIDAFFLQLLPKPLLTVDQVRLLEHDNVVSEDAVKDARTLEGLGITPHAFEAIVPAYLERFRRAGQYDRHRVGPPGPEVSE